MEGCTKLLLPIQASQLPLLPGLNLFYSLENFIARYFLSDLKLSLYLNKSKERQLGICLVSDLTSLASLISGSALAQTCFSQLTLNQIPPVETWTLAQSLKNMFGSSTSGCPVLTPEFASTNATITPPLPGHLGEKLNLTYHSSQGKSTISDWQIYTTCPTRGTAPSGPPLSSSSPSSSPASYQLRWNIC